MSEPQSRTTDLPPRGQSDTSDPTHSPSRSTEADSNARQSPFGALGQGSGEIPGFVIDAELGRGGMGVVFRAHQVGLNRIAALKMIRSASPDSKQTLRFLAEAEAVAAIHHPNVVGVYEYGESHGSPYLALEYCSGGSLTDWLLRDSRLDPTTAAKLVAELADGVNAAHEIGIVHRDLKPGNVLFDRPGGTAKVADFGLAKRTGGVDLTRTQAILGTPAYMAPEQARGQIRFVGPEADVWALGVILYECLTGSRPFQSSDSWEILRQVLEQEPASLRSRSADIPRDLELICLKCLQKEPHDRYPLAGELAADLRRFLAHEPIQARPTGSVERVVKWVRRNPIPTSLIVALSLLVTAVASGAYFTNQELQRANTEEVGRLQAEQREQAEKQARLEEVQQKNLLALQGTMQLALQSGKPRNAVQAFEAAVAEGLPVTPGMRLSKAKALYALNEPTAVLKELRSLDETELSTVIRSQVDLLIGTLLIGEDDAEATRRLTRARTLGLPPADDSFARGLLATTTPEALAAFQLAIDRDTTHVDARAMAAMTLLCLGRIDEAVRLAEQSQPLAPAHPHFTSVLIAAYILRGDSAKARQYFEAARVQFSDPKQYEAALGLFQIAGSTFALFRKQLSGESFNLLSFSMQFLPGGELDRAIQKLTGSGISTGGTLLRTPPFFRTAMKFFVNEALASIQSGNAESGPVSLILKSWLPGFSFGKPALWFTEWTEVPAARARLAEHPEGTLKHVFANRLYELAYQDYVRSNKNEASRQKLYEAALAYEDAAATPGLFNPTMAALESAAVSYLLAGQPSATHPGRREWLMRGALLVRQRVQSPEPIQGSDQYLRLTAVAFRAREDSLVRFLLTEWARSAPLNWFYYAILAQMDFRLGAHDAALRSIEMLSDQDIREAYDRDALVQIRAECRQRLGRPELAPTPRRVN